MHSKDQFEALKTLILAAAQSAPEIGPLEESTKWGQPSFAPLKRNIGSSVRIELRDNGDAALMFICTSGLVDEFRELYEEQLTFEGKRAIILPDGRIDERNALTHCIQRALNHKLRQKQI